MINTALLPRPFSSDRPRIAGYEPLVRGQVLRVAYRKRNSWYWAVYVDDCAMAFGHTDTKAAAVSKCAAMILAYAEAHYVQV